MQIGVDMLKLKVKVGNKDTIIKFGEPTNLSTLLIDNDVYLDRPCSGKGTCGKCKVKFLSNPPKENSFDVNKLSQHEIDKGYRLSCKCKINNDAHIKIEDKQHFMIKEQGLSQDNEIFYNNKDLIDYCGIAIDLGTTTIVVYLVNLEDGHVIDVLSTINPQREYGDNVITRSEYINTHTEGLVKLQSLAINKINELINSLCLKNNLDNSKLARLVLSGNTIMQHIIMGVNPHPITIAPFTPIFTEQKIVKANDMGFEIKSNANCYITNSISGYIGGDIVAGIIASNMDISNDNSLLVDIGTNGEIVLNNNGKMYSCSVAAGPAFEGEHIKFGLGGVIGAINKATNTEGKLEIETIGNEKPIGICGSGLLDIVAYFVDEKIIDKMGSLNYDKCTIVDDEHVYYITDDIYISQKDIREIQLAKSAIAAGIEVLINKAGIQFSDIDNVYLSGGFGSYLNVKSAAKIGMLNTKLKEKCLSIGNSAGMGSVKSLLSDRVLQSLDDIVNRVEYIELSLDKEFNNLFIDNMLF